MGRQMGRQDAPLGAPHSCSESWVAPTGPSMIDRGRLDMVVTRRSSSTSMACPTRPCRSATPHSSRCRRRLAVGPTRTSRPGAAAPRHARRRTRTNHRPLAPDEGLPPRPTARARRPETRSTTARPGRWSTGTSLAYMTLSSGGQRVCQRLRRAAPCARLASSISGEAGQEGPSSNPEGVLWARCGQGRARRPGASDHRTQDDHVRG